MARAKKTTSEDTAKSEPLPDDLPKTEVQSATEADSDAEPRALSGRDEPGSDPGEPVAGEIQDEISGSPQEAQAGTEGAEDRPTFLDSADAEGMDASAQEPARPSGEDQTAPPTERESVPPPPTQSSGSGGGFVAGLLGGAVAIAGGVGFLWLSNPDLLRGETPGLAAFEERLSAQTTETEGLAQELAALREEVGALPSDDGAADQRIAEVEAALTERLDALATEVAAMSSTLDVLEGRISQVESRPPVMEGDAAGEATAEVVAEMRAALDAQRAEIASLAEEARGRIEAAEAEAAEMQAAAEEAARAAVARAALSRLRAALEAGGPYAAALSDLSGVSEAPMPEALMASAESGVPTVADLQRSFPEAAREALAASIRSDVDPDAGAIQRLGAFLKAQTGARSLSPREGEDPDAVLSRAEAAVADGDIAEALALLDQLPPEGRSALADWRQSAARRAEALAAADALAADLPAN